MSAYLRDIPNNALILNASGTPAAKTASITGAALDMLNGDGLVTAIQDIGTVSGTNPTWDGKFQQSDTTTSGDFADITGATFTQVTASTNVQAITFQRDKRYLRFVGTIGGSATPTFGLDVLILEQKKQL